MAGASGVAVVGAVGSGQAFPTALCFLVGLSACPSSRFRFPPDAVSAAASVRAGALASCFAGMPAGFFESGGSVLRRFGGLKKLAMLCCRCRPCHLCSRSEAPLTFLNCDWLRAAKAGLAMLSLPHGTR